jgi:dUTPase
VHGPKSKDERACRRSTPTTDDILFILRLSVSNRVLQHSSSVRHSNRTGIIDAPFRHPKVDALETIALETQSHQSIKIDESPEILDLVVIRLEVPQVRQTRQMGH